MDKRNLAFISDNVIEFDSSNRFCKETYRIRRRITDREASKLREMIVNHDYFGIDSFCYRIV